MTTPRRPVRVAHVVGQLGVGGMEKLLVEFARFADRRRFDLVFVCLGGRGPVADEIEAHGWPVVCLDEPPGLRPGLVLRLARLFRRWRARVVHTHNDNPLIYAGPAARLAGAWTVLQTRHGTFQTGGRHATAFRYAALAADRVVCVSADSERLSAGAGIGRRRLATVCNGIDTTRFAFTGPRSGGPVVMVGRMVALKGVDTLLRAVALAVRETPDFRLDVAGDGPELAASRTLAAELGLDEHVRFLGMVRDVPGLLRSASAFVLPSYSEGISLTLLEAMASGLPVVATAVGGSPEVVADGDTGLLVPARDAERLAIALLRVWRDPDAARRMGEAGRRRVEGHFDVRAMVAAYEALYARGTPSPVAA